MPAVARTSQTAMAGRPFKWRGDMQSVRPMLATLEDAPLESDGLVYEPKYDGIRALVEIDPGRSAPGADVVAARQREDRAISRSRRRAHALREKAERPGRARRRDRRARRQGRACRFSAAAEPHSPDRIQQPVRRRTRRVHRVRHPARRQTRIFGRCRSPSGGRASSASSATRAPPFCARARSSRATRASCINTRSITAGKGSSPKTRARCITPANARATGAS